MTKVLSVAIHSLLRGYLDDSIKSTINVEHGGLHVKKMLLRAEVINEALAARDLPFIVTLGYCGDVLISLPWLHWSTGAVIVEVDEIYLQLQPKTRNAQMDVDGLRLSQEIAIQRAVDELIAEVQRAAAADDGHGGGASHQSVVQLLVARLKRQLSRTSLSVDVARVHVQLADRDFDGGLLLGGLRIFKEGAAVPEGALKKKGTRRTSMRTLTKPKIEEMRRASVQSTRRASTATAASAAAPVQAGAKADGAKANGFGASSTMRNLFDRVFHRNDGAAAAAAGEAGGGHGHGGSGVHNDYAVELTNAGLYCSLTTGLRAAAEPYKARGRTRTLVPTQAVAGPHKAKGAAAAAAAAAAATAVNVTAAAAAVTAAAAAAAVARFIMRR